MKKLAVLVLTFFSLVALVGCGNNGDSYTIEIIIPAGSTDAFVYADEEISPQKDTLKISAGAGIASAEVLLKTVEVKEENAYEPVLLKQGEPVKIDVERNAWFKLGVGMQNPSDKDITVAVKVENVEVRIE